MDIEIMVRVAILTIAAGVNSVRKNFLSTLEERVFFARSRRVRSGRQGVL
jgi:hypothetical protein